MVTSAFSLVQSASALIDSTPTPDELVETTNTIAAGSTVTSSLQWPWLLGVVAVVTLAVVLVVTTRARRQGDTTTGAGLRTRWVANSARLAAIPGFTTWVRKYRWWQWLGAISGVTALAGLGVVAARPVTVEVKQTTMSTRDIVLCLDISGSMLEYDRQMVDVFGELVEGFDGERIALSIFNETSRTVFPLTNDYELVAKQLDIAYEALDPLVLDYASATVIDRYLAFTEGTALTFTQSSLIGDGLANCALLFDDAGDPNRSRSIILATDNDLRGEPVYTLSQAAELTRSKNIELNALYGASSWVLNPNVERDYQHVVEDAGGYYYRADDAAAVSDIISRVQAQQAIDLDAAPEVTRSEHPGGWLVLAVVSLGALLLVQGRLRE